MDLPAHSAHFSHETGSHLCDHVLQPLAVPYPTSSARSRYGDTELPYQNDDDRFIQSLRRGTPKFHRRAQYLWHLTCRIIVKHGSSSIKKWEGDRITLLEELLEEGVWIWQDGDEQFLEETPGSFREEELPFCAAQTIADALTISQAETSKEFRHRKVDPAIRCAMICHLSWRSTARRTFGIRRGYTVQWMNWESPVYSMKDLGLNADILSTLSNESAERSLYESFSWPMFEEGHDCHCMHPELVPTIKVWLLTRAELWPEEAAKPTGLGRLWDFERNSVNEHGCRACLRSGFKLLKLENEKRQNPLLKHPRVILLLFILALEYEDENGRHVSMSYLRGVRLPRGFLGKDLFHPRVLQQVERKLEDLPVDLPTLPYLSWVNAVPERWRPFIVDQPSSFWDDLVELYPVDDASSAESSANFDLRGWLAAVLVLMHQVTSTDNHLGPIHVCAIARAAEDMLWGYLLRCMQHLLLPSSSASSRKFHEAIKSSYHSCWDDQSSTTVEQYVSTMTALLGGDDIPVVGFDPEDPGDCLACQLETLVRRNASQLSPGSHRALLAQNMLNILNMPIQRPQPPDEDVSATGAHTISPPRLEALTLTQQVASDVHTGISIIIQEDPSILATSKSSKVWPGRSVLVKEIKTYLFSLLERHQVIHVDVERPQLPWTTLPKLLLDRNCELVGWPVGVPLPGEGENDHKGVSGLSTKDLRKIHDAMHSDETRLGLRSLTTHRAPAFGEGRDCQIMTSGEQRKRQHAGEDEEAGQVQRPYKQFRVIEWCTVDRI